MAPGGVPGAHPSATPPSVDPNPSTTTAPNRVANRSVSPAAASLPYMIRNGFSASSGRCGVAST
ncbi:Uncharacterised protein [Mycobacteroides abscessus]|nr:Uncharacterised protein [Mycobacteroides abscessus]CQA12440.1 Uncharacterised protein [Mycobacteroides abscessus]